jgi:hypothetical protein
MRSRIRAFFLTDRVGHTLAMTIGFFTLTRWLVRRQIARLRA